MVYYFQKFTMSQKIYMDPSIWPFGAGGSSASDGDNMEIAAGSQIVRVGGSFGMFFDVVYGVLCDFTNKPNRTRCSVFPLLSVLVVYCWGVGFGLITFKCLNISH